MLPKSGHITNDELTMVRDYIMYPHMLMMSDRSLQDVRRSQNPLKNYFEQIIQLVMDRITRELATTRREFKLRDIKVFEDGSVDGILYYPYRCRGYEARFGIVREALRTEISYRFGEYASDIFKKK